MKTKHDTISYPLSPSEFEIQSYIYRCLKSAGHDIRGEVRSKRGTTRFDLVVFENFLAALIVEVKKNSQQELEKDDEYGRKKLMTRKRQLHRYRKFGVPLKVIGGMSEAEEFVTAFLSGRKYTSPEVDTRALNDGFLVQK